MTADETPSRAFRVSVPDTKLFFAPHRFIQAVRRELGIGGRKLRSKKLDSQSDDGYKSVATRGLVLGGRFSLNNRQNVCDQ